MLRNRRATHRLSCIIVTTACVSGCGRSGSEMIPVEGQVTYRGGPCPGPGSVIFAPLESTGGATLRPASAEFNEDGQFSVRSFREGDGVKPGTYRVTIQCWKERPQGYTQPGIDVVPRDFHPEDLTVATGEKKKKVHYDVP